MISRTQISLAILFAACGMNAACQKVPLLAPSGSTITLTSAATALPLNGTAEIIAQVIEPSGTPPSRGTLITFTTTLGAVQPFEAETDINGRVIVKFAAGSSSGTATITASSGGSNVGANGAIKIAIGAAAVGRITLGANPATVPASGGNATIIASVTDINGNPLPSAPVTFTTTAGGLSAGTAVTDSSGTAQTVLTTTKQATVTATAGLQSTGTGTGTGTGGTTTGPTSATVTVNVNTTATITVTASPTTSTVGQSVTFGITYGTGATFTRVVADFGDGTTQTVPGMPPAVNHAYTRAGTYGVRVTGTDAFNDTASGAASVTIANRPQPTVGPISVTPASPTAGTTTAFSTTITPSTGATIQSTRWEFGDGRVDTLPGNAPTAQHIYSSGTYTVTVTATDSTGESGSASTIIVVR